jgi:hypothetical protein
MQAPWSGFVFLAACALASGCSNAGNGAGSSGSTTAPSCTTPFTACGGNVVGTWSLSNACVSKFVNPGNMACPASTAQLSEDVSGTIEFKQDGTFVTNANSTLKETMNVPASCLVDAGVTESCQQLQNVFNQPTDAGAPSAVASCTSAPMGGCTCQLSDTLMGNGQSATYSTLGYRIGLGGTPPSPYCVQGNTLTIQTEASNGMPGSASITLIATKQ